MTKTPHEILLDPAYIRCLWDTACAVYEDQGFPKPLPRRDYLDLKSLVWHVEEHYKESFAKYAPTVDAWSDMLDEADTRLGHEYEIMDELDKLVQTITIDNQS